MKDIKLKYLAISALKVRVNAKLIYSLLLDFSDENGESQISLREVSQYLRITRKTVSTNLHCLASAGAILIIPQFNPDGGRKANKYIVR